MRFKKRLLSIVLAVLLAASGVLLSPTAALPAQAAGDLYGTGSADDINIIKLIDMALNKGGMSMSPATIRAFLDFWWSSVKSDLSECINNADSAITTTQAFASYVFSALEDSGHYDKLGPAMIKYVEYVCALEGKSLSDIKQLLTQEGTFRQFLLSYVVDEEGNIAGTVNNRLKKYQLKTGLVNMARQAADLYISEYEGYYLFPTIKPGDIVPSWFSTKEEYDAAVASITEACRTYGQVLAFSQSRFLSPVSKLHFVCLPADYGKGSTSTYFDIYVYDSSWVSNDYLPVLGVPADGSGTVDGQADVYSDGTGFSYLSGDAVPSQLVRKYAYKQLSTRRVRWSSMGGYDYYFVPFSLDGSAFRVFKSLDALKSYSVGKGDIYYTTNYASYDYSVDNSIEFTGTYYNNYSTTYSHDVIQNNIDNSTEINETTVNNVVNNYVTNVTNNYGESSGSGSGSGSDSGSDSGSGNWWDIGSGIEAFIKGVASLLDFALKLLGDLVGLLATFATSVLDVLKSLAVIGTSFGDFLKEVFGFLPEECISLIISSIGAMCIVGVIKAFKK